MNFLYIPNNTQRSNSFHFSLFFKFQIFMRSFWCWSKAITRFTFPWSHMEITSCLKCHIERRQCLYCVVSMRRWQWQHILHVVWWDSRTFPWKKGKRFHSDLIFKGENMVENILRKIEKVIAAEREREKV
jgi:hypothetical protein